MKKNLKYVVLVGIISLFPLKSKALTGNFKVTCNDTNLRVGRSTKCTLKGQFNESLSGLHFSIEKSNEISISNVEIQDPYERNTVDGLNFGLVRSGPINTEHNIATFDVKLDSDITSPYVKLYNLEAVPAEGYDSYTQNPITVNFTNTKSADNTLKTITVGSTTINVQSGKDTYKFTTANNVSKVNISVTTNNTGASTVGTGEKNLSVGLNTFTIEVIAENGTSKPYTIEITRSADSSEGGSSGEVTPDSSDTVVPDSTPTPSSGDKKTTPDNTNKNTSKKTNKTSKSIKNPKTGIYNGVGVGIIIIVVSGLSYLIVRKEKYFNK